MKKHRSVYILLISLVISACAEDRYEEIQTVEVTSTPLERDFIYTEAVRLEGSVKRAKHEMAKEVRVGKLETKDAFQNTTDFVEPFIIELPEELPYISFNDGGLEKPISVRPDPEIINSGFPERTQMLAPRYKDAANFDFQYLDVTQGLNSSYVFAVEQDEEGYLWFGTYGGGLARYDGQILTRYTEYQGLPSSYIWALEMDRQGRLWVGTYGAGLCYFDGKAFTKFTAEDGIGSDYIFCIQEDIEGNIWIGTDGGGVVKYDGSRFHRYSEKSGLLSDRISAITQDDNRDLWFGSYGGGVMKFDGKGFMLLTEENGLPDNFVECIEKDKNGNIWIGMFESGAVRYDGKNLHHFTPENGLSSDGVHGIEAAADGTIWFGTEGGGICSYDNRSFSYYTTKEGISSDYVRTCFTDSEGNIWFGTDGGGVNRYKQGSFRHFTEKDGMLSNFIWDIMEDSKGNIWYGTDGSGACKFDGEKYTYITEKDGLSNDIVMSIIEDHHGYIWLATDQGGISIFDGKMFEHITTREGLPSNAIWDVMEDSENNIWIATDDAGVCKFDGYHYTYYTEENGLLSNTVTQVLEDRDGNIWWVCKDKGISKFNGAKIQHYTEENGLSSNMVDVLYEDKSGYMWAGHNGKGLDKIDGNYVTNFTTDEGLCSNYIWSIVEDNNQLLWVCTENGISCLDIDSSLDRSFPKIYSFSKQDGLKSLDFYENSVLHDSKNRLWWGSSQALTMLDLNKFHLYDITPTVHLTNVMINEEEVDFSQLSVSDSLGYTYTSVQRHENVPEGLKLDYDYNHLTFYFSGLDWNAPQQVRYSYFLTGVDNDWSTPTTEHKADYRSIPVGKHTFKVKALSSAGIWSQPVEINFKVYPPWWRTWWAFTFYILLIIAFSGVGYKLRTIKYRKRQRLLEKTVRKRTAEIYSQKQLLEAQKLKVDEAYQQLEAKNNEVLASINYAKRIQTAILPPEEYIRQMLPESFVFYRPKDIVAGDFYWCEHTDEEVLIAAADCTGHGVPGAMVSVICHTALNKALREYGLTDPGEILNKAREIVIEKFEKSPDGLKDGMDISLAVINKKTKKIRWAGANNPLWIMRKGSTEIDEIRADKQPIGKYPSSTPFTTHVLDYEEGDVIYLLTDGFPDQFGGPKGKKYKHENLKLFMATISELDMDTQPYKLRLEFSQWKDDLEQIDDICIIGVRL